MTVKITTDDEIQVFEDVTKVEGLLAFDVFENNITIHQDKKKIKYKQYEIIDIEITSGK